MSNERLMMKGVLEDKRRKLLEVRERAAGTFIALRMELNPVKQVEDLNILRAKEFMKELHEKWKEIRKLKEEIARLEAELYA